MPLVAIVALVAMVGALVWAVSRSEAEQALVRLYDLTAEEPTAPPPSPADGVAGFKDLIARSQAEREALTRLLADFPTP